MPCLCDNCWDHWSRLLQPTLTLMLRFTMFQLPSGNVSFGSAQSAATVKFKVACSDRRSRHHHSPGLRHHWKPWFRKPETWVAWRAFLSTLFALPLSNEQLQTFHQHTGRQMPPTFPFDEAWLCCGRRAGKSFMLAVIASYLALCRDWQPYLQPGELGCIKIVATDRKQARTIYRYCRALLTKVPSLEGLVEKETDDELELKNKVLIEIQTANFRSIRSYTIIAFLADEIAYWRNDESFSNPDAEILAAARPAMSTVPGAMLLAASPPYARRGTLWEAYRKHYGNDTSKVLVWHSETRAMNPTVARHIIDDAMEADAARARAEYYADFRSDIEAFLPLEAVQICTDSGTHSAGQRMSFDHFVGQPG